MWGYNKKVIIQQYRDESFQKGHPLSTKEIKKNNVLPSIQTIYRYFESIQQLRQMSGLVSVKACFDIKYNAFIFKKQDAIHQSKKAFCKNCSQNPKTCGKDVEECMKEAELYINGI